MNYSSPRFVDFIGSIHKASPLFLGWGLRFSIIAFSITALPLTAAAVDLVSTKQSDSQSSTVARTAWGLSQTQWQRYQALMAGQRGNWSPNLDPLSTLGIHAQSEAERRRYAEQLARIEHKRVLAEIAFQQEYDSAWQRLFGDVPVIGKRWDKLVFAIDVRTEPRPWLDDLLRVVRTESIPLAIKVRAAKDDGEIRQWATQHKLPRVLVAQRIITLAHDTSRPSATFAANPPNAPVVTGFRDGSAMAVSLETLQQ